MAGKPELSVAPQQQPPGVQNVVVYVSNDNFAQAYAVGQQNVAGFTSQGSTSAVSQQNGAVVYANSTPAHTMASMVTPGKGFINKPLVKPTEFQTNGVLENGSVAHASVGNFYTCNASPFIAQNGFQQANITAYHNNVSHMGVGQPQAVPMLNNTNFDGTVKNVIEFSATSGSSGELYSVATQSDKHSLSGRPEQHKVVREESVTSETFIAADSGGYVVMGAEVTGQNGVMFPRCDSVRSETAESSCSSLSSGDSQGEASGVVLMSTQPAASASQSSDIVMYDNSVNVNMRPGQPLGNLVLTMVPPGPGPGQPGSGGQPSQPQPQAQPQSQPQLMGMPPTGSPNINTVTVPLGWKRIVTKGIVIYIR